MLSFRQRIDNYEDHLEIGQLFVESVLATNGTDYILDTSAILMGKTSGVSHDYAAGGAQIPLSFTIEVPFESRDDLTRIELTSRETTNGIKSMAKFIVDKFGK